MNLLLNMICIWCRKKGHSVPHFWRYQSKLHIHCEKCCGKALNFAVKNDEDFSGETHFLYGGPEAYPLEKIITNKKSLKVWPGTVSLRLSYDRAEPLDRVKEYDESR